MSTSPLEETRTEAPRVFQPAKRRNMQTVSDHFVSLANRVIALRQDPESHKTIGVCACGSQQGATTVARNLATAIAAAIDGRVLLVDTMAQQRHRESAPGWLDLLQTDVELIDAIEDTQTPGLCILPAGSGPPMHRIPVDIQRLKGLIETLKDQFEFVVFDLPVANDLSGCIPVASVLDGVLLVIAAGKVPAAKAVAAKRQLELARAHVIGVVLNKKRFYVPRFLRCLIPFANHE